MDTGSLITICSKPTHPVVAPLTFIVLGSARPAAPIAIVHDAVGKYHTQNSHQTHVDYQPKPAAGVIHEGLATCFLTCGATLRSVYRSYPRSAEAESLSLFFQAVIGNSEAWDLWVLCVQPAQTSSSTA